MVATHFGVSHNQPWAAGLRPPRGGTAAGASSTKLVGIRYRNLRQRGITLRKTRDLITGNFCLERRHSLLHDDRDFMPVIKHRGLRAL